MKEILLTSSVLILALVILRAVFRRAIPRRVQYALWALALLRLLVPFSIPGGAFSLIEKTQPVMAAAESAAAKPVYTQNIADAPISDYPEAFSVGPGESFTPRESTAAPDAPSANYAERSESGEEVRLYKALSLAELLRIGWYIGMAGMAAWFLIANLRFARILRRNRTPLSEKNRVYVSCAVSSPCLFGLFRPAIYVTPEAAQDKTRLRHVLIHEKTHRRHLDPLWGLLRAVCLIVYFFDPLVWLAAYLSMIDGELACDEGALAVLGEDERLAYGETLLALIPVRRAPSPMLASTSMASGKKQMRDRISRIAARKKPLVIALVVVLIVAAVVFAVCFAGGGKTKGAGEPDAAQTQDADTPDQAFPFAPSFLSDFSLTRAQFMQRRQLGEADVPEKETETYGSYYTHRLSETVSIEDRDFSVLLRFDPFFGGVLDSFCYSIDPQSMEPEERYELLMKLHGILCEAFGDSHADTNTPWIGDLASYEDFSKDAHLSVLAYWDLPGNWTLPNASDVSCTVSLHYAADVPVFEIDCGLSGHWLTPFEKEYGVTLPRELPDSGINELDRVLTALAQEFDGSGLPMEYDTVNRFLADKPEFLALGKTHTKGFREVFDMLRGGFDLDSTREHFLTHYSVWMLALDDDPSADFYETLSSETGIREESSAALLFSDLFMQEPPQLSPMTQEELNRMYANLENQTNRFQNTLSFLCRLYSGFLPDNIVHTWETQNNFGEDITLSFWTRILGSGDTKTVYFFLSDGTQHYSWAYNISGHSAVLTECYLTYDAALEVIWRTHAAAPPPEPADPLYLDFIYQKEADVLDALGLTEEDFVYTGRVTENEHMCILTKQKAGICGRDFSILLGFGNYQDPYSDERTLARFDYFLPVDDLSEEELYTLTKDVCTSLTNAYGAPRTIIDGTFSEIRSPEDFDPDGHYGDRWLVPGNWALDGAEKEKVLCAELTLSPPSLSLLLPPETGRVLWLRFYIRDNMSMQRGSDHLLHVWL